MVARWAAWLLLVALVRTATCTQCTIADHSHQGQCVAEYDAGMDAYTCQYGGNYYQLSPSNSDINELTTITVLDAQDETKAHFATGYVSNQQDAVGPGFLSWAVVGVDNGDRCHNPILDFVTDQAQMYVAEQGLVWQFVGDPVNITWSCSMSPYGSCQFPGGELVATYRTECPGPLSAQLFMNMYNQHTSYGCLVPPPPNWGYEPNAFRYWVQACPRGGWNDVYTISCQ